MRKYIENQLKSCAFANLDNFNSEGKTFIIPKYTKPSYDVGKCYIVKVSPFIFNNPNSVIATNWNNGSCPTSQFLKIVVSKTHGKMIYVDSLAYDFENKRDMSNLWSGWLSVDDLTQLARIV